MRTSRLERREFMLEAHVELKNLDRYIELLEQLKSLVKEINELDVEVTVIKTPT